MRGFMLAIVALGVVLILAGVIGRLGPYHSEGHGSVTFTEHAMPAAERVLYFSFGAGLIAFGAASLKGNRR